MILLSKKDAAAGSDGGKVSSPNFDTIICVLFSRWKRSSLVDAPTGESVVVVVVVVVSTKTPRCCFCPWCFASPDRAKASATRTTTQTDRKDDRIIISSRSAFDVRWGKMNGAVSCVPSLSLSLSLSFRHQHKRRRPTKETRRVALNKFVLLCLLRPFPKRRRRRRRRRTKRKERQKVKTFLSH